LALEAIRLLTGFTGVQRSQKGTRFDYYLGRSGEDTLIFNDTANLEVSGIFQQTKSNTVAARKGKKTTRMEKPGGPGLIGKTYICVVELSTRGQNWGSHDHGASTTSRVNGDRSRCQACA
jgi:hypothetical protein